MYQGRQQQGTWLSLVFQARNGSGVPTSPDAAPTLDVYSGTGKVLTQKVSALGRQVLTGLFCATLLLDSTLPEGKYRATLRWTTGSGSYSGMALATFEVVPGASVGRCVSMKLIERPGLRQLLRQHDSGTLQKNRGPRT